MVGRMLVLATLVLGVAAVAPCRAWGDDGDPSGVLATLLAEADAAIMVEVLSVSPSTDAVVDSSVMVWTSMKIVYRRCAVVWGRHDGSVVDSAYQRLADWDRVYRQRLTYAQQQLFRIGLRKDDMVVLLVKRGSRGDEIVGPMRMFQGPPVSALQPVSCAGRWRCELSTAELLALRRSRPDAARARLRVVTDLVAKRLYGGDAGDDQGFPVLFEEWCRLARESGAALGVLRRYADTHADQIFEAAAQEGAWRLSVVWLGSAMPCEQRRTLVGMMLPQVERFEPPQEGDTGGPRGLKGELTKREYDLLSRRFAYGVMLGDLCALAEPERVRHGETDYWMGLEAFRMARQDQDALDLARRFVADGCRDGRGDRARK